MSIVTRYLWKETLRPLGVILLIALGALLLERLLRILTLYTGLDGALSLALSMLANLVPHYAGLAIPASYAIAVLIMVRRLSADRELEALQACGIPAIAILRALAGLTVTIILCLLVLYHAVQPHARYSYRVARNQAAHLLTGLGLQEGVFLTAGDGGVLYAGQVRDGMLGDVFFHSPRSGEGPASSWSREGTLTVDAEGNSFLLTRDGHWFLSDPATGLFRASGRFDALMVRLRTAGQETAKRGESVRERLSGELLRDWNHPDPETRRYVRTEFHARMVRSLSPLILPMLAISLGPLPLRGRRSPGFPLAIALLLLFNYALKYGENLGNSGLAPPWAGLWGAFFLFGLPAVLMMWRTHCRIPGSGWPLPWHRGS